MDDKDPGKHLSNATRFLIGAAIVAIPQWISSIWSLFSSTPAWQFAHEKGVPYRMIIGYQFLSCILFVAALVYLWSVKKALNAHRAQHWTQKVETVVGRHFTNEKVVIDGKKFVDCVFSGVKLTYNGTADFQFQQCEFIMTGGGLSITTDAMAIKPILSLMMQFGQIKELGLRGATVDELGRTTPISELTGHKVTLKYATPPINPINDGKPEKQSDS